MNAMRKQRLILISLLLIGVGITVTLALFALRENINHYFSPTQIAEGKAPIGKKIRGGGLVVRDSVVRDPDSLLIRFVITDGAENTTVIYTGILPDLFKEGQGIVALGMLNKKQEFIAEEILAKHDETYMPPEVKKAIDSAHHRQQIENQEYAP
ncbi:MAG: cytochrome c maturation protein CcmE [Candidatus Endonucleobacter bathymodioli]|uniref:Cytochrome c-type biogenesis protein CcmE n=1 Tax=Candidatus Endonucleibacter bathymodioli TaxID=539814 RepID=A0AA90SSN8_9GAMM|nr:cytochrome c maturation protein CcmE [Candidatus Endonucleobacter bathymodioli]